MTSGRPRDASRWAICADLFGNDVIAWAGPRLMNCEDLSRTSARSPGFAENQPGTGYAVSRWCFIHRDWGGPHMTHEGAMKIAQAAQRLGSESAFEVLVRARALRAQGKQVVHLEIGEPISRPHRTWRRLACAPSAMATRTTGRR